MCSCGLCAGGWPSLVSPSAFKMPWGSVGVCCGGDSGKPLCMRVHGWVPTGHRGKGAGGLPAMHPLSQNKCFRYWPELHGCQEYGHVRICNLAEYQAQGYCVRELQVWRPDQVSPEGHKTCRARVTVFRKSSGLCWETPPTPTHVAPSNPTGLDGIHVP